MVAERKYFEPEIEVVPKPIKSISRVFGIYGPDYYTGLVVFGPSKDNEKQIYRMFLVDHDPEEKPDIGEVLEFIIDNTESVYVSRSFNVSLRVLAPAEKGGNLRYTYPPGQSEELSINDRKVVEDLMSGNNIDYVLG